MKRILTILFTILALTGCSTVISENINSDTSSSVVTVGKAKDDSYSVSDSVQVALSDEDVKITKEGTYVLQGTLNGSVIVEVSDSEDVQLVLDNVTINSGDFAGIYIVEGDEITITLVDGSVNTISDSNTYTQIDDNEVDALIYSKADLIINGEGTLNLNSDYNHGIVSKDDLVIGNGTYNIDVAGVGLKGKDLLQILDGNFKVIAGKDGLKSDNDEDEDRGKVVIENGIFVIESQGDAIYGYRLVEINNGSFTIKTAQNSTMTSYKGIKSDMSVLITGGEFEINTADDSIHSDVDIQVDNGTFDLTSSDDSIHADSKLVINGGNYTVDAHEGLEATYIVINDGDIVINASDDGINAAQKVNTYTATVEINGGNITINMAQGDTDGVDSNGYVIINGGTISVNAQNSFDAELGSEFNGGTLIINGQEVDEIPADMMAGGMGGGFGQMGQPSGMPNRTMPEFSGEMPTEGMFGPQNDSTGSHRFTRG